MPNDYFISKVIISYLLLIMPLDKSYMPNVLLAMTESERAEKLSHLDLNEQIAAVKATAYYLIENERNTKLSP
ncbi:MAG: hypothetical protein CMK50_05525 [Propionibacteriaceae bacterium]|nr:hypothetical protein [Propionibacteriaceae bacterium]